MPEKIRNAYLSEGQVLNLTAQPDGAACTSYRIGACVGEGGSAVCYDAVRIHDGKTGKLKEFYPFAPGALFDLRREPDGTLTAGGSLQVFDGMREDYLRAFALLNRTMAQDPDSRVLKNYIPDCEILYGSASVPDRQATVYIWTAGTAGLNFADYLEEVRSDPETDGAVRLYEILTMIRSLTDCVRALHMAGLMHLDLKPSNFMVLYDSTGQVNPAAVSLFDINTLYPAESTLMFPQGTDGYAAPELIHAGTPASRRGLTACRNAGRFPGLRTAGGRVDNRADIYSIGAMLFAAIVVSEEMPDGRYRDAYYDRISQLVSCSRLIAGTDAAADSMLTDLLIRLLKRSLAYAPSDRYYSCSNMIEDLDRAKLYAQGHAVSRSLLGANRRLVIVEERQLCSSDPGLIMRRLLYEHPLYEALQGQTERSRIRVLTAGTDLYAQKFIDVCLEAGQMAGTSLEITVLSDLPDWDRRSYLSTRPQMDRFVNVNGSMDDNPSEAYAVMNFMAYPDGGLLSAAEEMDYDYVLISLGNDLRNETATGFFSAASGRLDADVPVCYVCEKNMAELQNSVQTAGIPVCVSEPVTPQTIHPQLEQMAFYTHLSWYPAAETDRQELLKAFRADPYEYDSSIAFALSVPYKLYGAGIDAADPHQAAFEFNERILERMDTDPTARRLYDMMAMLEHRRWVIHMAADGWTAPLDAAGKLNLDICEQLGKAKNETDHTHACMVHGTADTPLRSEAWRANHYAKWDDPSGDDMLDALDRVSVELYRRLKKRADALRRTDPVHTGDPELLRQALAGYGARTHAVLEQYLSCLEEILNGSERSSAEYDAREHALQEACEAEKKDPLRTIPVRLAMIRQTFMPAIEANRHTDYKAKDAVLIGKIPFILTGE